MDLLTIEKAITIMIFLLEGLNIEAECPMSHVGGAWRWWWRGTALGCCC